MSAAAQVRIASKPSPMLACPAGPFVVPRLFSKDCRLSLVVPTFQEAANIEAFLEDVCSVLDRRLPGAYEVIVVDDNSRDLTWRLALRCARELPAVRVIRRIDARGLAEAVIRGYQAASGSVLGTINADFQHPPEVLADMIDRLDDAEIAVASRFCEGGGTGDWDKNRLMMSQAATLAGKAVLPAVFSKLSDPMSGCYLFNRAVIEEIELFPIGFKTLIEIMSRGRAARVAECPYEMRARRKGASKATLSSMLSYLEQLRRLKLENGG